METTPHEPASPAEKPEPTPAHVRESEADARPARAAADEAQTLEEPGYGHGV